MQCINGYIWRIHFSICNIKGEGASFISGFNTMSKEQQRRYDTKRMSKDQRNVILLWMIIMGMGAVLSCLISQYMAIVVFIIWLIVFFKNVHMTSSKGFEKYKVK